MMDIYDNTGYVNLHVPSTLMNNPAKTRRSIHDMRGSRNIDSCRSVCIPKCNRDLSALYQSVGQITISFGLSRSAVIATVRIQPVV